MSMIRQFSRGTAWMSLSASGSSLVSFVVFIVLSRLLEPGEIGLVAFALIFVELGKTVVNAGFQQAIVQTPKWDESYASTCFHTSLGYALLVTVLIFLVVVPLSARYYDPAVEPVLQVLCGIFLIEAFKTVHEGKLKREFNFRAIALRTVLGSLVSGAVGIYLAMRGHGVWALVWQQLINHLLMTTITVMSARWRPKLEFSTGLWKGIMRYSTPVMLSQVIGSANIRAFEFLIGIFIGPAALGFYRVGGRALYILQDVVLKPFEATVLSALSRMSSREEQAENLLRILRVSAFVTVPVFFGTAAIAPDFVNLAFGSKWALSGEVMFALALGVAPLAVTYQLNAALLAAGQSRKVMNLSSAAFVISAGLGLITVHYGVVAAASMFAFKGYLISGLSIYYFLQVFEVSLKTLLTQIFRPYLSAAMMLVLVLIMQSVLLESAPALLRLGVSVVAGAVFYLLLNLLLFRGECIMLVREGGRFLPDRAGRIIQSLARVMRLQQ